MNVLLTGAIKSSAQTCDPIKVDKIFLFGTLIRGNDSTDIYNPKFFLNRKIEFKDGELKSYNGNKAMFISGYALSAIGIISIAAGITAKTSGTISPIYDAANPLFTIGISSILISVPFHISSEILFRKAIRRYNLRIQNDCKLDR